MHLSGRGCILKVMRIVSCTRTEAEAQLTDLFLGWIHLGDDARANEAHAAMMDVRAGDPEVTAGHTTYRIQETQVSQH